MAAGIAFISKLFKSSWYVTYTFCFFPVEVQHTPVEISGLNHTTSKGSGAKLFFEVSTDLGWLNPVTTAVELQEHVIQCSPQRVIFWTHASPKNFDRILKQLSYRCCSQQLSISDPIRERVR